MFMFIAALVPVFLVLFEYITEKCSLDNVRPSLFLHMIADALKRAWYYLGKFVGICGSWLARIDFTWLWNLLADWANWIWNHFADLMIWIWNHLSDLANLIKHFFGDLGVAFVRIVDPLLQMAVSGLHFFEGFIEIAKKYSQGLVVTGTVIGVVVLYWFLRRYVKFVKNLENRIFIFVSNKCALCFLGCDNTPTFREHSIRKQ
jgi:hypothetical protein